MKKVSEILKLNKTEGDVGIEIEVEGANLQVLENAYWRSVDDGSLRGHFPDTRCEYVFARPRPVYQVHGTLKMLADKLKDSVLKFSYRTSVHVHVNCQDLEYQQLLAFMYAYYLLEEPFMNYCGKKRKGNNFCLRLSDAEGVLATVGKLFAEGEDGMKFIQRDMARYAAMNVEALTKYGSLEFRGMEGNLNVERINTWAVALVRLREYARKMDNPKAIFDRFHQLGPVAFMQEALGDVAAEFHYPRLLKDVVKSFSISIDLPMYYGMLAAKPKPVDFKDKYKVGQIISHAQAVEVVHGAGDVKLHDDGERYVVFAAPTRAPKLFAEPAIQLFG